MKNPEDCKGYKMLISLTEAPITYKHQCSQAFLIALCLLLNVPEGASDFNSMGAE
jgi:hypothetical protein